jgi:signal transduction histidine kinase
MPADPSSQSLIDRLTAHRTLQSVPRDQLAWLAATGVELTIEPGGILTPSTGPVKGLYVVLDGHLSIRVDRGAGPRIVMEWHGGDVTGMLPYSRIKAPPGNVVAEERTSVLLVEAAELPRMIRECYDLTAVLVHVMLDRARVFKSSELLDEKMSSLGRLAAGLAHELNNPASAVARSAKTLVSHLNAVDEATKRFCGLNLSDEQCRGVAALRNVHAGQRAAASPLELADRQDAIDAWLTAHQIDVTDIDPLVRSGLRPTDLDALGELVGLRELGPVLAHVSAGQMIRQLASEIDTAATRIHSLVAAVKGFTYLNQQSTFQPIAIGQGLADTITVLTSKAKSKAVQVTVDIASNLPPVDGYGGELNQVWANLLDNAIDATPGGHVRIEAATAQHNVIVRVIDDGPGISAETASRMFEPFFTTKPIGEGTGLGLDIARRIVLRHHGAIDMTTSPGRTEFRVTLPRAD